MSFPCYVTPSALSAALDRRVIGKPAHHLPVLDDTFGTGDIVTLRNKSFRLMIHSCAAVCSAGQSHNCGCSFEPAGRVQ